MPHLFKISNILTEYGKESLYRVGIVNRPKEIAAREIPVTKYNWRPILLCGAGLLATAAAIYFAYQNSIAFPVLDLSSLHENSETTPKVPLQNDSFISNASEDFSLLAKIFVTGFAIYLVSSLISKCCYNASQQPSFSDGKNTSSTTNGLINLPKAPSKGKDEIDDKKNKPPNSFSPTPLPDIHKPIPLKNTKNTCALNTLIQIVMTSPDLRKLFSIEPTMQGIIEAYTLGEPNLESGLICDLIEETLKQNDGKYKKGSMVDLNEVLNELLKKIKFSSEIYYGDQPSETPILFVEKDTNNPHLEDFTSTFDTHCLWEEVKFAKPPEHLFIQTPAFQEELKINLQPFILNSDYVQSKETAEYELQSCAIKEPGHWKGIHKYGSQWYSADDLTITKRTEEEIKTKLATKNQKILHYRKV